MCGRILILFFSLTLLSACSFNTPDINTLCYRDDIGNYVIKWETDLPADGLVKIYVSDSPNEFTITNPAVYASISDGVATYITRDNVTRRYFRLSFNNKYYRVVGSRGLSFDQVQNIRDLGGYQAAGNKTIQWGMVYRSGDLSDMNERDSLRLANVGLKTIIDLRSDSEIKENPLRFGEVTIIDIPIPDMFHELSLRIQEERMRKRDALIFMQDQYIQYVTEYSEQFAKALEVFQNPDNYPILFCCTLGKDKVGFLSALLLSALDVPQETIIQDYTRSSEYIDISRLASLAEGLNQEGQEAMTVLLSSSEEFIEPTLQMIRKDYGSIEHYLVDDLHLTDKKASNLREILLH